eukprot:INCI12094.1.p1 GENE.INCI12094.1~~INCI12094.1.p1  ORF type:complete len:593 (-),score=127.39 INCI12094.1:80-1858(-)
MNVTVATDNRAPFVLPLSADTDVGSLCLVLEADTGIPSAQMRILFNGQDIQQNHAATLGSLGVTDAALIYVTRLAQSQPQRQQRQQQQQQQQQPTAESAAPLSPRNYAGMTFDDVPPNCDPKILREIIRVNPPMLRQLEHGNPELASAVGQDDPQVFVDVMRRQTQERQQRQRQQQQELAALYRRVEEDPFDVEAQKKVEEIIRARNVESNHQLAREHLPEAFTRVCMLYINAEVNGVPLKAFVDSGAQNTIMTQACAERAGIMRLIDRRYAGQAVGVGTCKILGKVHMAPLKIGSQNFNCSFTVLENTGGGRGGQSVEFLFGLDMLKRHQANINLKTNRLEIEGGSGTISVPFLSESEIPDNAFNPSAKGKVGLSNSRSSGESISSSSSSSNNNDNQGGGGGADKAAGLSVAPAPGAANSHSQAVEQELEKALEQMGNSAGSRKQASDSSRPRPSTEASGGATPLAADLKRHRPDPTMNATTSGPKSSELADLAASLIADLGGVTASGGTTQSQPRPAALQQQQAASSTPAPSPAPSPAPAPAPAPAPTQVSEQSVAQLVEMGFSREQAVQALFACSGDVDAASLFLIQFS